MKEIIKNTLAKLSKNSSLDEIKAALTEECIKSPFAISMSDYKKMFDEIIIALM